MYKSFVEAVIASSLTPANQGAVLKTSDIQSIAHREQVLSNAFDCTFLVGPEKQEFKALKGVLTLVSPVFQTMFYGGFPETADIPIPDVTPAAFQALLCHAYNLPQLATCENWNSVEDALDILYVSHKYAVFDLEIAAKSFLLNSINAETFFVIYQDEIAQNTADLKDKCLDFFAKNTLECLNSEKFLEIPISLVQELFNHKEMNISSELELFQALERYASRNELKRSDVAAEDGTKELESLIKGIRFLSLTAAEFEKISGTELLNEAEKVAIFAHTVNPCSTRSIPATISSERLRPYRGTNLHGILPEPKDFRLRAVAIPRRLINLN